MRTRIFAFVVVLGALGWLLLLGIQRQFRIGRFAASPQELTMLPGQRAIVGGGRAVVGFAVLERRRVTLEVRCAGGGSRLELAEGAASEEVCGVRVRWLGAAPPLEAPGSNRFEVSWDD
ncbi:MAG TPA: hypothetical protein VGG06_17625 [Thermoanaerobaculia bacterium]